MAADEGDLLRQRLRSLTSWDFDHANVDLDRSGEEELRDVCEAIRDQGAVLDYAEDMFAVMERLDDADDLGSPGPLVHTLESIGPGYRPQLIESVRRKPAPLSLWMINRIVNLPGENPTFWLGLLREAASHTAASAETRRQARDFLAFQTGAPDPRD